MRKIQPSNDNTIDIFTSGEGSAGSKVSIHKSALLSALTLITDKSLAGEVGYRCLWSTVNADNGDATTSLYLCSSEIA